MRERPILFSGPMVRAILDGRKTQTRRCLRPPPTDDIDNVDEITVRDMHTGRDYASPYGEPGDRLWVRETWGIGTRPCPQHGWRDGLELRADDAGDGELPLYDVPDRVDLTAIRRGWRPSIFMPRWASRVTLEVTEVRVHRLQEIEDRDARAEGVERVRVWDPSDLLECNRDPSYAPPLSTHAGAFEILWDEINGKRAPWSSNPWVWAITFKVVR